jgi:arylsulfatase A-like enzyme
MKNILLILTFSLFFVANVQAGDKQKPNIIFILADDLGYGDVQCLNPERGMIATPHIDKIAKQGMIFTDAHTTSSVCTPSRYGILTGRYNWRTHLQSGVLWGFSKPLIESDRLTVAGLLKQQGYATACIGKWHLGMLMPTTVGDLPQGRKPKVVNIDWNGSITDGPNQLGFDYFFGISASLDMAPYIYIENDKFLGECTLKNGLEQEGFSREDVLPQICRKSIDFIQQQDATKPFFAYIPLNSPHTPIVPTEEWKGKSGLGNYGDFVMETDWVIGQILAALDEKGFSENTLVVVSSDNGCSKAAKITQLQEKGHYPSAYFRGSKADLWDGGHRVPFIVRWPGKVKAGSESNQTITLMDFMATCSDVLDVNLPDNAGKDGVSFLPALSGQPIVSTRAGLVHHSISGHFAYRQGKWKLLLAKGSGGWTSPTEKQVAVDSPILQLYDMEKDPGETSNLYNSQPEVVERLLKQLKLDINRGRSTTGSDLQNDLDSIVLWKSGK